NFAHSEVFMSGPFTAYFLADALYKSGFLEANPIVGLAMVFALSMAVSTLIAVLLERVAYRPLRRAPRLVPLITAIGASFFLQYTFRGLYGGGIHSYPDIAVLSGEWTLGGFHILRTQAIVLLGAVAMMLILYAVVMRTK